MLKHACGNSCFGSRGDSVESWGYAKSQQEKRVCILRGGSYLVRACRQRSTSLMSFAIAVAPSSRRQKHGSLIPTLRRLRCTASWKVVVLLLFFVQISPALYFGMISNVGGGTLTQHHDRHRLLAKEETVGRSPTSVSVTVKRSARNPVDTSQVTRNWSVIISPCTRTWCCGL